MERVTEEHFADKTSWKIYENLEKLYKEKEFKFLIKAHELCGVKTWDIIKIWYEIYNKCKNGKRELVFWGIGRDAEGLLECEEKTYHGIGYANWPFLRDLPISVFVDKTCVNKEESDVQLGEKRIPIISPAEAEAKYKNAVFMIGTADFYQEIREEILEFGVKSDDIYGYYDMTGVEISGKQYFDDFFLPQKEEIVIDAGMYRGETLEEFIDWNKGLGYSKIIGIEPDKENYAEAQWLVEHKKLKDIDIRNVGIGSTCMEIKFKANGNSGSHFDENGNESVMVESIDSMVGSENVSYIKMDIEGFELEALKGAKNTIQRCHPRLLVCLYHKPEDVIEIPQYILELDSSYKFYVRIYSNTYMETLLYAL